MQVRNIKRYKFLSLLCGISRRLSINFIVIFTLETLGSGIYGSKLLTVSVGSLYAGALIQLAMGLIVLVIS